MDFDPVAILKSVAPTLATAFGGPLAGLAVEAIGGALGMDAATKDTVTARLQGASSEDLLKLKTAEQDFVARMRQLDVDVFKLEAADRTSARELAKSAKTPGVLSWFIVMGWFALNGFLIIKGNPASLDDVILGRILGTLDTAFGVVLSFWLGTSFSSRQKDSTINKMQGGAGY